MATERGWLIENGLGGDALRYRTMRQGMPVWTADHNEALRFARRIDAEKFAEEDEDAWRIAEHAWDDLTPNVELSGPTAGLSPEGRARTQGYASKDAKC